MTWGRKGLLWLTGVEVSAHSWLVLLFLSHEEAESHSRRVRGIKLETQDPQRAARKQGWGCTPCLGMCQEVTERARAELISKGTALVTQPPKSLFRF